MRTRCIIGSLLIVFGSNFALAQEVKSTEKSGDSPAIVAHPCVEKDGYGIAIRLFEGSRDGEDRWGKPLPIGEKEGRYFLAAPGGKEYGIDLVMPKESKRVLYVVTIDGVNIITGETGTSDGQGYVTTAAKTDAENVIPGWRRGSDKVARFVFTPSARAYATLTGRPDNVGIIGVKIYAERRVATTRGGGGARSKGLGGHDTGTGYGDEAEHHVDTTVFETGELVAQFAVEYASVKALAEVGIVIPEVKPSPLGHVDPFPGDKKDPVPTAPPPPGWKP